MVNGVSKMTHDRSRGGAVYVRWVRTCVSQSEGTPVLAASGRDGAAAENEGRANEFAWGEVLLEKHDTSRGDAERYQHLQK